MRVAICVWLFVNLLFVGVIVYSLLLVWSHSRLTTALSSRRVRTAGLRRTTHSRAGVNTPQPYVFHRDDRIHQHRAALVAQLRRIQLGESLQQRGDRYRVRFRRGRAAGPVPSGDALLCRLRRHVAVRAVRPGDEPFHTLGLDRLLPAGELLTPRRYNSCAVVSSAGSLLGSALGRDIDGHDAVLRFNDAPTEQHRRDVGARTTVRVLNSRVVVQPRFHFLSDDLYRNVSLLVWDPSKYGASLQQWYDSPDFPVFTPYFQRRLMLPDEQFHLLAPGSLWSAWDFLQMHTHVRLPPHPPSSGFIGILLMLHQCDWVDVFEYAPSLRLTRRCHYYDDVDNEFCTLGSWHPLAAEKLLVLQMNSASDRDVFERGVLTLKGFNQLNCD